VAVAAVGATGEIASCFASLWQWPAVCAVDVVSADWELADEIVMSFHVEHAAPDQIQDMTEDLKPSK